MSEARHTPGPWYSDRPSAVWGDVMTNGSGEQMLAHKICDIAYHAGGGREEQCANARLIASAPDLLAALVTLVDTVNQYDGTHAGLDAARAAIRKATGTTS